MSNNMRRYIVISLSLIGIIYLFYALFTLPPEEIEVENKNRLTTIHDKKTIEEEKSVKEIESFNQTMKEQHERQVEIREKYSDKLNTYEKAIAERYVELAKTQIHDIKFWGRIIDQYGEPVVGAAIKYSGGGYVYATGSPQEETKTDASGNFLISAQGRTLHINKPVKTGYQFQIPPVFNKRRKPSWTNYSELNPYIINAWKIDRYPEVIQDEQFLGFTSGKRHILNLLSKDKIFTKNKSDGDITVYFNQTDETWDLTIEAIDGGLQETTDQYRYLAPVDGYVNQLFYEGKNIGKKTNRKLYFTSRNNTVYGTIHIEVWPDYRDKSVINMNYIINLEQGRNLTVKPMRSGIPDQ